MCGILGFNWKDASLIRNLTKSLRHRGPDQSGTYVDRQVSLGHRRLSIIDLSSRGRQPMTNKEKNLIITYNGEIFNFKEIKSSLEKKGYVFKSKTDTEVVLYAYQEYGPACVKKFNGQFSFCIYDKRKKKLFLARDHIGIKPLYYYNRKGKFIFASELKTLIQSKIFKKKIDHHSLNHYFLFGYTPLNKSILHAVYKLPPGHTITYNLATKKARLNCYWKIKFSDHTKYTEKQAITEVLRRLDQSVQRQLMSDVPIGAFLSGGLDSSIICAIIKKYIPALKTFSIRFQNSAYDESAYARRVSQYLKTDHHEITFTAEDVFTFLKKIARHFDEPFADPSTLPTCLVAYVAKKHVKVSLSGTGGDELFGGYPRYNHYRILRHLHQLPSPVRHTLKFGTYLLKTISHKARKIHTLIDTTRQPYQMYPRLFSFFDKSPLHIDSNPIFDVFRKYFTHHNLYDALSFDQHEYLPADLLFKEDMSCMLFSLEGRVPFLDPTFVHFVNQLPLSLKMKYHIPKYLLKKAAETLLPPDVIYRKKHSFSVPFKDYFRNELRNFSHTILFNTKTLPFYNKSYLQHCWESHQNKTGDYTDLFLTIIMFNIWYTTWFTKNK